MRVANKYPPSGLSINPKKCLETSYEEKKSNYLVACLKQRRHFTPFVVSVDGLLGVEADEILKRISSRLEKKWKETYSCTCGYVKSRVVITLVRATHCCF